MATNTGINLRAELLAQRAEIDEALRALDRIEALARKRSAAPRQVNAKSYSQAVLDALKERPKTHEELCAELHLTYEQVHHAATSHRLRKLVERKRNGNRLYYRIRKDAVAGAGTQPLSDAIVQQLADSDGPMKVSEVVGALHGKVPTTAKNFHGTVATTLSTLFKSGRIKKVPGGGYYTNSES